MHDLLFVLISSLLLLPIAELSQIAVLRIVFGLLYVGLLPGYALIAAVFPGREDLEGLERLGLSLVFSISMVSLTAFLLDFSPWGIKLFPLLISLNVLTLLACGIAYWRRHRLPPGERFSVQVRLWTPNVQKVDRTGRFLALILMFVVTAAIASTLYTLIMPGPQETFTEFYVLGPDREFDGVPTRMTAGEPITVILGLVNHEQADVQYRIERVGDPAREQIASILLAQEGSWEQPYTFTLTDPGENQEIIFLLYKQGLEEPYRSLHLWVTVRDQQSTSSGTAP